MSRPFPPARLFSGALLAAPLLLAGCISFGPKPPAALLVLAPATAAPVGAARSTGTAAPITIDAPAVPATIATARIPVHTGPTTVAYVPDAAWSEPPARLFARLLGETVTARSGMIVVTPMQGVGRPNAELTGALRAFGIDGVQRQAVVTYDAALRRAGAETIETRRFEARAPVAAIDGPNAGTALNAAANDVATQVADWVGG